MTYSKQSLFSQNDPLLRHKGDGAMKVALYCRLSEEDRNKANKTDDSISIQNQKSMLMQYADEKGWCNHSISRRRKDACAPDRVRES